MKANNIKMDLNEVCHNVIMGSARIICVFWIMENLLTNLQLNQ
jgi:hypothetical protein